MKWLLPASAFAPAIPEDAGRLSDYFAVVTVGGELTLKLRRPRGWTTPGGRQTWLVEGDQLGGYIGLSRGADGWHIGTPATRPSPRLIDLAARQGWQPIGNPTD